MRLVLDWDGTCTAVDSLHLVLEEFGDRAVYTQSNEMVVVTGVLVIAETERSYTFGTHFEFDLKTSQGSIVGPHVMELKVSSPGSTNAPRLSPGLDRRIHPSSKPRETPPPK